MNLAHSCQAVLEIIEEPEPSFLQSFQREVFSGDLMAAKLEPNRSWASRCLLEGKKVIEKGLRWRVGNGQNIRIYQDPWIARTYPFALSRNIQQDPGLFTVHRLMLGEGVWNEQLIHEKLPSVPIKFYPFSQ